MTELQSNKRPSAIELRDAITERLDAGAMWAAVQSARQLLEAEPGVRTNRFLRKAIDSRRAESMGFRPFKVALLSSFSIEFIHDALIAHGFASALKVEIYQAPFGAFRQELLEAASGLYAATPDAVVLAVEPEAWLPSATLAQGVEDPAARFGQNLTALAQTFRARSTAALLIHNSPPPVWPSRGIASRNDEQLELALLYNGALTRVAKEVTNVHVVDYAGLVRRFGAVNWYDDRMRLFARAPIAQGVQGELAAEYLKFFRALSGLSKKCLVVDLDNTLWGGILGEDGLAGISLGAEYPGNAFVEFQRRVLELRDRGVILAIASKNNPADVEEAFAKHPFMVIKPEHFSAAEIGWQPKTASLVAIAKRLNIGLDHLVFVDDNPFECEQVREALPMITVIQLPRQPERYVATLLRDGWFETVGTSDEDRRRSDLYRQRDAAEALRAASGRVEDFYRELDMTLTLAPVEERSLVRAAQLTQKTNQFNTTTRRYSEAEVAKRADDPRWVVRTVAVRDRFGDNGIVGLMMARAEDGDLEVDTFLLSCRVIGRTIETAMLAALFDEAGRRGLARVSGLVIPTAKNAPVRDVFERHGFKTTGEEPSGATHWARKLTDGPIAWPEWFRVEPPATFAVAAEHGE